MRVTAGRRVGTAGRIGYRKHTCSVCRQRVLSEQLAKTGGMKNPHRIEPPICTSCRQAERERRRRLKARKPVTEKLRQTRSAAAGATVALAMTDALARLGVTLPVAGPPRDQVALFAEPDPEPEPIEPIRWLPEQPIDVQDGATPPERLRVVLAMARDEGIAFDEAWGGAVQVALEPLHPARQVKERAILILGRSAWMGSYERQQTAIAGLSSLAA
jgi:hypothetical protein